MSTVQDIQAEIIAGYAGVTLPNSLGSPSAAKHEPEGGYSASDLPGVIVTRSIKIASEPLATSRTLITREYIVDLLTYVRSDNKPIEPTERDNTSDCIEVIEQAFPVHGLTTTGAMTHRVTADTGDTDVFLHEDNKTFIGARFRHEVTYIQVQE